MNAKVLKLLGYILFASLLPVWIYHHDDGEKPNQTGLTITADTNSLKIAIGLLKSQIPVSSPKADSSLIVVDSLLKRIGRLAFNTCPPAQTREIIKTVPASISPEQIDSINKPLKAEILQKEDSARAFNDMIKDLNNIILSLKEDKANTAKRAHLVDSFRRGLIQNLPRRLRKKQLLSDSLENLLNKLAQ